MPPNNYEPEEGCIAEITLYLENEAMATSYCGRSRRYDPETDEPIALGELLASNHEDPATAGARNVDWDVFLASHDYRYGLIVAGMIEGKQLSETARGCGGGYYRLWELREKLAVELREFIGSDAVIDSLRVPTWRGNIMADRERAACQADRRRQ